MWVGQQLADGLDFWGFLGSLILGGIILGIYTGLLGYVGAKTGLSLDLLSQRAFGEKGSYLPSAMTSFTQIGWFGVGSFVSGGTATPNFARFAKDGKAGAITTVVAFFIGNSLMFFFGAVSSIFVGGNDIFEVMVRLNLFYRRSWSCQHLPSEEKTDGSPFRYHRNGCLRMAVLQLLRLAQHSELYPAAGRHDSGARLLHEQKGL